MQCHAGDLRVEIGNDWSTLSDAPRPDDAGLDAVVHHTVDNWRHAEFSTKVGALLEYAEKITEDAAQCSKGDVELLRLHGWSDAAIHDAVQVVSYFNYINRVADALGVEMEPGMRTWGRTTTGKA